MPEFKPGLPATLVTVVALIVLIGLGSWQAMKIGPKTELLARLTAGLEAQPIDLPVHLDDPAQLEYRRFTFEGFPDDQPPVKVFGTDKRGRSGYHLYAPVKHRFGRWVLVNWGWIPAYKSVLPSLPSSPDLIRIEGVLLTNPEAGSFTPENDPNSGNWYRADIYQLAEHFELDEFYHFRIVADHLGDLSDLPIGGQVRIDIPNDHFEYMLTWYGLAIGLIGVYGFFGFRRANERDDTAE